MTRATRRVRATAALGLMAVAPVIASGCGDSYAAVFDSLPIALVPHPPIGSGPMGEIGRAHV